MTIYGTAQQWQEYYRARDQLESALKDLYQKDITLRIEVRSGKDALLINSTVVKNKSEEEGK